MRFDLLTIFPKIFESYFNESIIKRACRKKLVDIRIHDLRAFTSDKHRTTDDRPYGGGPGMVMKIEPIYRALKSLGYLKRKPSTCRVVLLTPRGKTFTQREAKRLSHYKKIVLICGRYEGVDERVRRYVDEEISLGQFVMTGGELATMMVVDVISRLIPGVLGDSASAKDESFSKDLKTAEYPHYTRPEIFRGQLVPKVLLSGNHRKIAAWRESRRRLRPK